MCVSTMNTGHSIAPLTIISLLFSLKYFNVTEKTGIVYVTNNTLIDREVSSLYSATLQAMDTSNNTGTTVLEITLTDINDQPPKINPKSYNEFVKEGMPFRLQIEVE